MKAVIQFTKPEEARALPILLRHSPGAILPNDVVQRMTSQLQQWQRSVERSLTGADY